MQRDRVELLRARAHEVQQQREGLETREVYFSFSWPSCCKLEDVLDGWDTAKHGPRPESGPHYRGFLPKTAG